MNQFGRKYGILRDSRISGAARNLGMFAVIAGFTGVLATLSYYLASELFGDGSVNSLISKTVSRIEEEEISEELGRPLKYFGETTRYNRRMNASHAISHNPDGSVSTTLNFYLQGKKKSAIVYAEMNDHAIGVWDYNYLFVEYPDGTRHEIVKPKAILRKRYNVFEKMAEYIGFK